MRPRPLIIARGYLVFPSGGGPQPSVPSILKAAVPVRSDFFLLQEKRDGHRIMNKKRKEEIVCFVPGSDAAKMTRSLGTTIGHCGTFRGWAFFFSILVVVLLRTACRLDLLA